MTNVNPKIYHIIGLSPGNSYFKDEEVHYLLQTIIQRFGRVAILIADVPAISTYIALGYSENRARRDKAVPKGNALKNRVLKAMARLGYTDNEVKIFNWEKEVENNPEYKQKYDYIFRLYQSNAKFHESADATTREVLQNSKKDFDNIEKSVSIAVHYLLSEIAFLEFAPHYLSTDKVVYVYHRNWPIYEDYIVGKFDGTPKQHLDFLLVENPYETFNPVWGLEDVEGKGGYVDILDRIEKTKILRVGFTNYPPAFMYDSDYDNFSGIFYEIIIKIAKKYGWRIQWTEETGYGVITDGLDNKRFDIFGSTVWPTPERMQKADFSTSLYKSPTFVWLRSGFDINADEIQKNENIRVAIKENDITDSIAASDFPKNRRVRVPQLSDTMELLRFVADDRADFTFVEPYLAEYFNKTSSVKVVKLTNNPIRIYENPFIMKQGEARLKELWDKELSLLKQNGTIVKLIEKYTGSAETFQIE